MEIRVSPGLVEKRQFLNRLRILRGLDHVEVPLVSDWPKFRDNPAEYIIACSEAEASHVWMALRLTWSQHEDHQGDQRAIADVRHGTAR